MNSLDTSVELLDRLAALRSSGENSAHHETLALLELLGRCAFVTAEGGVSYAKSGLTALSELHEVQAKALLMRLQRLCRPASALVELVREFDFSLTCEGDYLRPPQRAATGLWLGRHPTELGMTSDTGADTLLETVELFVTRAHPENLESLEVLAPLPEQLQAAAFTLWCERHPRPAHSEPDDLELERLESLSIPLRLRTAVSLMERATCSRSLAETLIPLVEPDWKTPRDNADRAIADARLAAIVGVAGDLASADGLLFHANAGLDRENDPMRRADIFGALFTATSILANAPLGGPGPGSWLNTIDRLQRDKVVLRQRDALFSARQAAITTMPRAAQSSATLADRGHEALKDLGRRIPERWLDLLHLATATAVWREAGRDPETHLSTMADLLRRDGLPQPDARVELATITAPLAAMAPTRLVALGERLASPIARAIWWSTALLTALP